MTKEELIAFRKELHQYPECSGLEKQTAERIRLALQKLNPDELHTEVGGHGLVAVFKAKNPGNHVAFRGDIDALPIQERSQHPHVSKHQGVAHLCGHDGHTTILMGIAAHLSKNPPATGAVYLIFQPAEEIGAGARRMLDDERFHDFKIDYIFGLHNLPGYTENEVIVRPGVFTSASVGVIFKFTGRTSHASEPEKGSNPAFSIARIIDQLPGWVEKMKENEMVLATVVHCEVGPQNFGVSPGKGTLSLTLRANTDETLEALVSVVGKEIRAICSGHVEVEMKRTEHFHAAVNDEQATSLIQSVSKDLGLSVNTPKEPFRWSEDFGLFTTKYAGTFFGLGAGLDSMPLHNEYYDFNDNLLTGGISIFKGIIDKLT